MAITDPAEHGSERRLARYRASWPKLLDEAILAAARRPTGRLEWTYPGAEATSELDSDAFLHYAGLDHLLEAWKTEWPQRGRQQMWDGVARIVGGDWLLLEAKANEPEFVGSPCGAKPEGGKPQIEKSLNRVKARLKVHRHFTWLGSYYQYANRLAFLSFLREHRVGARLIFVLFHGDAFPDECPCPQSPKEWEPLIEARRRTLGLPVTHTLADRIHEVFMPAVPG